MAQHKITLLDKDISYNTPISMAADGRTLVYWVTQTSSFNQTERAVAKHVYTQTASSSIVPIFPATEFTSSVFEPTLSGDGQRLIFSANAPLLPDIQNRGITQLYQMNLENNDIFLASQDGNGNIDTHGSFRGYSSANGKLITFTTSGFVEPTSYGSFYHVFLKDISGGELRNISGEIFGTTGIGSSYATGISADGRYVLFTSQHENMLSLGYKYNDLLVKDLETEKVSLVNTPDILSSLNLTDKHKTPDAINFGSISDNGRYVSYSYITRSTDPSNLASELGYNTIVKDMLTGKAVVASSNPYGVYNDGYSSAGKLSSDGRYVAFVSNASNLLGNSNPNIKTLQLYLKDLQTGAIGIVSGANGSSSSPSNGNVEKWQISADGTAFAFTSNATDLALNTNTNNLKLFSATMPELISNSGNDTIDSFAQGVTLQGGAGDDLYLVKNFADKVLELAGNGIDSIRANISYSLPEHVENLNLQVGVDNLEQINGTGNALNNTIISNAYKSKLLGDAGDDVIQSNGLYDWIDGGAGNDKIESDIAGGNFSNALNGGDTIFGGAGEDLITASRGNDSINGGAGNDTISAADGDDLIDAGLGNNQINGGAGTDHLRYSGKHDQYKVLKTATGFTVTDKISGAIDTLSNVEILDLSDAVHTFVVDPKLASAYRVYQAAFNRTPDVGGLGFWFKQLQNGASLEAIANGFMQSAEFQNMYGANPSNTSYVTNFYQNVLHRSPDAGGLKFWVDALDARTVNVPQVLASFAESPENQAALVGVINNGVAYTPFGSHRDKLN